LALTVPNVRVRLQTRALTFVHDATLRRLTIRKPDVLAAESWTITITP
jgi:hypothetical protein